MYRVEKVFHIYMYIRRIKMPGTPHTNHKKKILFCNFSFSNIKTAPPKKKSKYTAIPPQTHKHTRKPIQELTRKIQTFHYFFVPHQFTNRIALRMYIYVRVYVWHIHVHIQQNIRNHKSGRAEKKYINFLEILYPIF